MDSSLNPDCCSNFLTTLPFFLHFPIQISWAKMLQICENPKCEGKISFAFSLCMKREEYNTLKFSKGWTAKVD